MNIAENNFEHRQKQAYRMVVRDYWRETLANWKLAFAGLLLTGVGTILVFYVPPLIIAKLLARYGNDSIPRLIELVPYLLAFGGLWLAGELLWRIAVHLIIKVEVRGMEALYNNAMRHMLDKDLSFFHDNFAGSLTTKTRAYSGRYIEIMDTMTFNVAPNIIPVFFISFILWGYSPVLVFGLFAMMLIILAIIIPRIKYRKKLVAIREVASTKASGYVADIYSNIDAVQSYANENYEKQRHKGLVRDLGKKMAVSWDYQNRKVDLIISPMYVLTNLIGLVLSLHVARTTGLGVETVFVTFSYYSGFTRFLWEFNGIYRRLETATSDAAQFTELLLDSPKIVDHKVPQPFNVTKGEITFDDVGFDHGKSTSDDALFNNLNLIINAGEKVGLVGHSGGGKTTLTKLIMRLMDVDRGQILIDAQNISRVKQVDLRKYIGSVPQDPIMFHRTLAENIAYGNQNATQKEIESAARMAHAHDFITELPNGYETLVGERGVKLSGGQRQRIAIARALLKNAPILLLDEATSALDSESESLIQDALWRLMEGKTSIVIAHRLSTIQKMDRILVLEDGEVVEEGTHHELLKNDGIYSELWKHQSGGFLED